MTIVTSAVDMSGVNTGFAAIAAEAFGLSPDQVRVVAADTATGPYSGASGGSKVTYTVGAAVLRAAEAAREKLLEAASEELEIAPADLEVVDGVVRAVGSPDHSITVAEISAKALRFGGRYEPIEGHGGSAQTRGAPSVAAHLAHVRVDRETGEVTLLAHVIAQDVGRALNPALVEGQMRGGAAQGIGWALFEELVHDEGGQLLTSSFLDYAIPLADRVPDIDTLIVEVPAPDGPFGAKGIGEAPVMAAAPAIANALAAAVGVRLRELPMTAPRVWAALAGGASVTSLERARAIVETYEAELRSELPADAYLFDAHTHLGDDIDGMRGRYEELSTLLDRFGFSGAFVFCLDEPDREPGFCVSERPHARPRGALAGPTHPVRPPRPHRQPDRRGAARARSRSPRNQAPSTGSGVRARRRAPRPGVRARGRARRSDPHPRWPGPPADRREPGGARPPKRRCPADRRARGDRGHGGARRSPGRDTRRVLRHLGLERARSPRSLPAGAAGADRVRVRLPVRATAELAARVDPLGAPRRLRRRPAAGDARRDRARDRRGRAAAARPRIPSAGQRSSSR